MKINCSRKVESVGPNTSSIPIDLSRFNEAWYIPGLIPLDLSSYGILEYFLQRLDSNWLLFMGLYNLNWNMRVYVILIGIGEKS